MAGIDRIDLRYFTVDQLSCTARVEILFRYDDGMWLSIDSEFSYFHFYQLVVAVET